MSDIFDTRVETGKRWRADLADSDLADFCLYSLRSGADVERVVKDCRRSARHGGSPLLLADLMRSLTGGGDVAGPTRRRAAVHQASHIITDVVLFGHHRVNAVIANTGDRAGAVIRMPTSQLEGTYEDYHRSIRVIVEGRKGEELLLGNVSRRSRADLADGTAIAAAMVGSLEFAGKTPLLYRCGAKETAELLSHDEVRVDARAELGKTTDACRSLLTEDFEALWKVVAVLEGPGRTGRASVADIIAGQCASWCCL
jgi:hypothetical protein